MSILLGVCDQPVSDDDEAVSPLLNKIGGCPDFYSSKFSIPKCSLCGHPMLMVLQLYCPLDNSPYDRTLYVFACCIPGCWNKEESWRVLRSQQLSEICQKTVSPSVNNDFSNDWCDSADDWGQTGDEVDMVGVTLTTDTWGVGEDTWGEAEDIEGCLDMKSCDVEPNVSKVVNNSNSDISGAAGDLELCGGDPGQGCDLDLCSGDPGQGCDLDLCSGDPGHKGDLDLALEQMNINDITNSDLSGNDGSIQEACKLDEVAMVTYKQSILGSVLKRDGDDVLDDQSKLKSLSGNNQNLLCAFHLSAVDEPLLAEVRDRHVHQLMKEYSRREGCDYETMLNDTGSNSREKYEKSAVRHGDEVFYKFMKRVSVYPQQCLRYSWCGQPLPISKTPTDRNIQKCPCGSERVFEFQLMPALVSLLKYSGGERASSPPVEFGTVLVFTCRASCWQDGQMMKDEAVIVQADPDQHRFKV